MKKIFILFAFVVFVFISLKAENLNSQVVIIPKNVPKLQTMSAEAKTYLEELSQYVSLSATDIQQTERRSQDKIYVPTYLKIDNDNKIDDDNNLNQNIKYQNQWYLNTIAAYDAWRVATGKDIIIAVIDTGIDYNNEIFEGQLWINSAEDINHNGILDEEDFNGIDDDGNGYVDDIIGYDFVDWSIMSTGDIRTPDPDPMDEHGHGTQVASVIAGKKTAQFSGIAYNAKIMTLRTHSLHGTSECKDIVNAIIYAVLNGANIINLSSGEGTDSPILHTAIKFATAMNVVVVCSAGNEGNTKPHYPSDYDEVICVGGCNQELERIFNFGDRLTITAPGSNIYVADRNNTFKTNNGTSFSTPIVSSVVAMILEKNYSDIIPTNPQNSATNNIKSILQSTALQVSNGWTPEYGAGIVNAFAAIKNTTLSDFRIIEPTNDAYIYINNDENPEIKIVGSTIHPLLSDWIIRISDEPTSYNSKEKTRHWDTLFTDNKQLKEQLLAIVKPNIEVASKTYTISLLANLKNGNTTESRIKITFIKEKPQITKLNIYQPFYYQKRILLFNITTNLPSYVKIYYKEQGSSENYKTIISNEYLTTQHTFTADELPIDKDIEGYAVAYISTGNMFTIIDEIETYILESEEEYWTFNRNSDYFDYYTFTKKEYSFPCSYIYDKPFYTSSSSKPKILASLLDANYNIGKLSLFTLQNNEMQQIDSSKNNLYTQAIGDVDNDGENEIVAGSYGKCFIYKANDNSMFSNVLYSTDENVTRFCEGIADLNNDGKQELIYSNNYDTIYICDAKGEIITKSNINTLMQNIDANKYNLRTGLAIGDFYGDGKKYIALTPAEVNYLLIIELEMTGELKVKDYIKLENNYYSQARSRIAITACDLNADNNDEIILMHYGKINDSSGVLGKNELWTYKVFNIINDKIEKIFEDDIWGVRIDAMFANQNSTTFKNGITTGNIDGIEGDEVILCAFPNLYILKWDNINNKLIPIWNFPASISNSAMVADFDANGKNEVAFNSFNETEFYEFNTEYKIGTEIAYFNGWAEDVNTLHFEWKHNENDANKQYELLLIETNELTNPNANFTIYPTNENHINISNLQPNTKWTAFVRLKNYPDYLSEQIEVWTKELTKPIAVTNLNNKILKVLFNERLAIDVQAGQFILTHNNKTLTPVAASSTITDSAVILYFSEYLADGDYNLIINEIKDAYNNKTQPTTLNFTIINPKNDEIYLANLQFIPPKTLIIEFSQAVETITATNPNNYKIQPNNVEIENIITTENPTKYQINLNVKPTPLGKNYLITASENIKSTDAKSMTKGAGNTLGFVLANDELNNVFIYPNPIKFDIHTEATIANLTKNAKIEILNINGILLRTLNEYDGNGGIAWDICDEAGIKCEPGVYILRTINTTNNQENLTKFAIIK